MDDKSLKEALQNSFNNPLLTDFEMANFLFCQDSVNNFVVADNLNFHLSPCVLYKEKVKSLANKAGYDIFHCAQFSKEYDLYKYYAMENIFISGKNSKAKALCEEFDLTAVSRQSAQEKCLIATIIPATLSEDLTAYKKDFLQILNKITKYHHKNKNIWEITAIIEFVNTYNKIIYDMDWLDILFWKNKILLHSYIKEVLRNLSQGQKLTQDFIDKHKFIGESSKFMQSYVNKYRRNLLILINKAISLNNQELIDLAYNFFQSKKSYQENLTEFKRGHQNPDIDDLLNIHASLQEMFNCLVKLCYIDGVRRAFEKKYLPECKVSQNSPLPSVAPTEEIKKIRDIVISSKKISCEGTQLGKYCLDKQKSYLNYKQKLDKLLADSEDILKIFS